MAMIRICHFGVAAWLGFACVGGAQAQSASFPTSIEVARDTYFDFGPPFHYYDLTRVATVSDGLSVERVVLTPEANFCWERAKVEVQASLIHRSMPELLGGKNPCSIQEKDLRRELKRRKKGLVFSGANVAMQLSCGGKDRQIRMDILDRDLFAQRPDTPEQTSWTMRVLDELDKSLDPGAMDKPIFHIDEGAADRPANTELVQDLRKGKYDKLFGPQTLASEIVGEAEEPAPPPATVRLVSSTPFAPVSAEMPKYPPIAKLARLEGSVGLTFDLDSAGRVQNVEVTGEARVKMLGLSAAKAVADWKFPEAAYGKNIQVTLEYKLNCPTTVRTDVN